MIDRFCLVFRMPPPFPIVGERGHNWQTMANPFSDTTFLALTPVAELLAAGVNPLAMGGMDPMQVPGINIYIYIYIIG